MVVFLQSPVADILCSLCAHMKLPKVYIHYSGLIGLSLQAGAKFNLTGPVLANVLSIQCVDFKHLFCVDLSLWAQALACGRSHLALGNINNI